MIKIQEQVTNASTKTIEYNDYLSIKDAHDRQYNYMKITIFTLIGMIMIDWI